MSNDQIQLRIRAIAEGFAESEAQLKGLANSLGTLPPASSAAGAGTRELNERMTTLHEVLGGSRRETILLEQTFLSATGVTGGFARAIEALMTGLGPVGLAIVGIGLGLEFLKSKMDEAAAHTETARLALVRLAEEKAKPELARSNLVDDALKKTNEQIDKVSAALLASKKELASYGDSLGMEAAALGAANVKKLEDELNRLVAVKNALTDKPIVVESSTENMDEAAIALAKSKAIRDALNDSTKNGTVLLAQFNDTQLEGANNASQLAYQQNRVDDAIRKTVDAATLLTNAENAIADAQRNATNATQQRIAGMAAQMVVVSQVTKADLDAAAAGKYVDKPDENIRRLRLYPEIDSEMFKKLPATIQTELKAAMESGGKDGFKLKIDDLIAKGENFSDPRMWDIKGMAAGLKDAMQREKDKARLTDLIVKEAGIDPNDPALQKALGTDQQSAIAGITKSYNEQLQNLKASNPLLIGLGKDAKGLEMVGVQIAKTVIASFNAEVGEQGEAINSAFKSAVTGVGDDRYMRKPVSTSGPLP